MARVHYLNTMQKHACKAYIVKWRRIGCAAFATDFAAASQTALQLYDLLGFDRPTVVLHVASPTNAVLAGVYAHSLLNGNTVHSSGLPEHIDAYVLKTCKAAKKALPGSSRKLEAHFANRCKDIASQTYSRVVSCMSDNALHDFRTLDALDTSEPVTDIDLQDHESIRSFLSAAQRELVQEKIDYSPIDSITTATNCLVTKFPNFGYSDLALLTAIRDVLLPGQLATPASFSIFETLAKTCGGVWLHENVLVVCDRPSTMVFNDSGNLHCTTGPSVAYSDGFALYHLKGVRVPAWLVLQPEQLTTKHIDAEKNTEVRRIMLQMFGGIEEYIKSGGGRVVAALPADYPSKGLRTARLIVKNFAGDAEPIVYVDLLNSTPEPDGTTKRYLLRVDPWAYGGEARHHPHAAAASTWRYADFSLAYPDWRMYQPVVES